MQLHRRPCHIFKNQIRILQTLLYNTLLIKIRDDILNALDRGEVTIAVMTDFSKAFDAADYFTLTRKLHSLNISSSTLNLTASYLMTEPSMFK